jgi:UPF0755 protein
MRLVVSACLWLMAGAVVGLVVMAVVGGAWLRQEARQPGPLTDARTVVIAHGVGLVRISHQLEEAGVIRWWPVLVSSGWLMRVLGAGDVRAGEYAFVPGASPLEVFDQLRRGRTVVHRLTVAEGLSVAQVVAMVRAEPALSGEVADIPEEGSLLPDTYHFSLGDSRSALVQRMRGAMSGALAELWPGRASGLPLETPAQAVVLASIVEKETGQALERPRIAGVFYNRLAAGMRLQSDPTVIYALTQGKAALGRPLSQADLHVESPFNTYQVSGLPPGAIGNPGRAALQAVLAPERHDFLYFVADGNGGHAFARTLADHNHNVAHWRQHGHTVGGP